MKDADDCKLAKILALERNYQRKATLCLNGNSVKNGNSKSETMKNSFWSILRVLKLAILNLIFEFCLIGHSNRHYMAASSHLTAY
jgi:hypothetical protein